MYIRRILYSCSPSALRLLPRYPTTTTPHLRLSRLNDYKRSSGDATQRTSGNRISNRSRPVFRRCTRDSKIDRYQMSVIPTVPRGFRLLSRNMGNHIIVLYPQLYWHARCEFNRRCIRLRSKYCLRFFLFSISDSSRTCRHVTLKILRGHETCCI